LEEIDMLYPPVAKLLKDVESRYLLVNVVAHRARQIAAEAEEFGEDLPEKPVTLAIREVADGKLNASLKEEYMN
jgi:DNA-directed RNA polymerase subunit omega